MKNTKMKITRGKLLKIPFLGVIAGVLVLLLYFQEPLLGALYYFFAMMLVLGILLFQQGDAGYAFVVIILQIIAWLVFVFVIRITVFNMLFPKIRVVDELKNCINYARKVKIVDGEDPRFVYMKIKFKFFPVFRWHTFKVPKPEFQGRNQKPVKNGVPGVRWKRMPSSLDIITKELNIKWNPTENTYELTPDFLPRINEKIQEYRDSSLHTIKRLSGNVTEAIRGDSGLLKEKYQMGMPLPSGLVENVPKKNITKVSDVTTKDDVFTFLENLDG